MDIQAYIFISFHVLVSFLGCFGLRHVPADGPRSSRVTRVPGDNRSFSPAAFVTQL